MRTASLIFILAFLCFNTKASWYEQNNEWDYLLFVEHWPVTVCIEWLDKNIKNNCTIPKDTAQWTIHGIWPTKIGTEGPNFCNNTWHFNETKINSIEPELETFWTNIEENTKLTSLWKHEWQKHGTCAATLLQLNNEFKYFDQGISWVKGYSIGDILKKSDIVPRENGYSINVFHDAIVSVLGVTPVIQCTVQAHTKISLLSEVRLCFDKSLNLISCDVDMLRYLWKDMALSYTENGMLTNCDSKKPVMYLDSIPKEIEIEYSDTQYYNKWLNVYRLLHFLMWFTL